MAEMDTSSGGGHKKGPGVKKSKKLSTRVDLTPMVDLGFLLITFFVFTTTMAKPTAMNMTEPNDDVDPSKQMKVKESAVMTILLGKADKLYYYYGSLTADNMSQKFKSTNYRDIRQLILDKKRQVPNGNKGKSDLMYIIKADKESTFKNAIDVLDEMTINAIPEGHYAEVDITDTERELIRLTEVANGVK
ncbi:ExbD/TolR family protein [Ferruginibacter sp. SUN002]|uniref:ExbD/TolR family protein n=1 Tax=Ferruginibacter sp. SUN002 TaxID=2937789 RepID=UPI003D35DE4A